MGIILASASPRRRELLEMLAIGDFQVIPAAGEEKTTAETPEERVKEIALGKGLEVAEKCSKDDIVIAADTLVHFNGIDLGKPKDEEDALSMLMMLSGETHTVYTGVAVLKDDMVDVRVQATEVTFVNFTEKEALGYIATKEPMDKAGAYGAQGKGAVLVHGIKGDFFNVMGLPICLLSDMLKNIGIHVFE